jgi:diguanylate cyclase (GGDEF)-like protein
VRLALLGFEAKVTLVNLYINAGRLPEHDTPILEIIPKNRIDGTRPVHARSSCIPRINRPERCGYVQADRQQSRQNMPLMHARRPKLVPPLIVVVLTACAITAVWLLIAREDSSRADQLRAASATLALSDLQSAPFTAEPRAGGDQSAASLSNIQTDRRSISRSLMKRSQSLVAPSLLASGRSDLVAIEPVVRQIYAIAVLRGGLAANGRRVSVLQGRLTARSRELATVLAKVENRDASSAEHARLQAKLGVAAAMVLLVIAFLYFYFRAIITHEAVERLALENKGLLDISRVEARTDALTGLGNRRALASALAASTANPCARPEHLLAIFDLDGFKEYNDSFGHAAGDALLHRLGQRLAAAGGQGYTYRMGGDEFCMLASCAPCAAAQLLNDTVAALEDGGDGWHVSCSHGAVWIPSEADTESRALKLADDRMYRDKRRTRRSRAALANYDPAQPIVAASIAKR